MEKHSLRRVSGDLPETLRKLCLSTKFPLQEIRRNNGILRSGSKDERAPALFIGGTVAIGSH